MQHILLNEQIGTIYYIHQPKHLPPGMYILTQIHAMCILAPVYNICISIVLFYFWKHKIDVPQKEGRHRETRFDSSKFTSQHLLNDLLTNIL